MKQITYTIIFLIFSNVAFAGGGHDHGHSHNHGHDESVNEKPAKGPKGGKLLKESDFSVELTIFEDDVPPQFRIFAYQDEQALNPQDYQVKITLTRFGGKKDLFELVPEEDFLTSVQVVEEPHSFDVLVEASYKDKNYKWEYQSHEGRTEISKIELKRANVKYDKVHSRSLSNSLTAYGQILPNEDQVAHIVPRFPGIIKTVNVRLGSSVNKGDILAVIESNQSLSNYEIKSPITGTVLKRHGTLGEFVNDDQEIFIIANLETVWADFQIYRDDFDSIKSGQDIIIKLSKNEKVDAKVSYVSPTTDTATQSKLIRTILDNSKGDLRPGLFVSGFITTSKDKVALAVKRSAIQTFRDWNVVYLTDGHIFQAIPVELGRQDREYVEILSGVKLGDQYVSENSYIIKADIEKSGASHDH